MKKRYKVSTHNSTVCGYPGREFDWSKFCWDGKDAHDFGDLRYSVVSPFIPEKDRGQLIGVENAPLPHVDDFWIDDNCQYLHVPYNWAEDGTIYRVRPNKRMRSGEVYRGKKIVRQKAVQRKGIWYWELEFEA